MVRVHVNDNKDIGTNAVSICGMNKISDFWSYFFQVRRLMPHSEINHEELSRKLVQLQLGINLSTYVV